MKRSVLRTTATVMVGGAIVGACLIPAEAASPTPSSLGLPTSGAGWSGYTFPESYCALGDSCPVIGFGLGSRSAVYTFAGFANGSGAASSRTDDYIASLRTHAISSGLYNKTKKFTTTYTSKKRQHKLYITVLEVIANSNDGPIVQTRITGRDLTRKKSGTKGPFAKKVGVAAIDIAMDSQLPSALTARKAKKLSQQMRNLIASGSGSKLVGQVKRGINTP